MDGQQLVAVEFAARNTLFLPGVADFRLDTVIGLDDDGVSLGIDAAEFQVGDGNLVLTLSNAANVRGNVDAEITIDDPVKAKQFKIHVFIVGPVADGGW